MNQKISIIGAGNMGSMFYNGLAKILPPEDLFVCDKSQSKLDDLGAKNTSTDPNETLKEANVVLFAVKPQSFEALIDEIKVNLDFKLIISIMAGISLSNLRQQTNSKRVIRAMPNLPVKINQGIIGWVASQDAEDSDVKFAKQILSALGTEIQVSHETMLDAVTVLSGCGPAYFFLLAELLNGKARSLGFTDEEAGKIAEKTFIGSAELLKKNDKTAQEWRQAVTSKGGVTETILNHLEKEHFADIFESAIDEGLKRNEELNS